MVQIRKIALYLLVAVAVVLLVVAGSIGFYFLNGGGTGETLVFYEVDSVPEGVPFTKLTEEDYEKYPVLKEIPRHIPLDESMFAPTFIRPGWISQEMGHAIYEEYGGADACIEHEGVIYEMHMPVA